MMPAQTYNRLAIRLSQLDSAWFSLSFALVNSKQYKDSGVLLTFPLHIGTHFVFSMD